MKVPSFVFDFIDWLKNDFETLIMTDLMDQETHTAKKREI